MIQRWHMAFVAALGLTCVGLVRPAFAQRPNPFAGRLDSETARTIERLIDSVSADGVPSEPLVAKALEGATKRTKSAQIVEAVRRLAASLMEARSAFGPSASSDELVAAANVLRAGLPAAALRELRQARGGPVTVPLVVLGDLLVRGVPPAQGLALMTSACRSGVLDRDLLLVRDQVRTDIEAGARPAAAAELRMRNVFPAQSPEPRFEVRPSATVTVDRRAGAQLNPALLVQRGSVRVAAQAFGVAEGSMPRYTGLQVVGEGSTAVSSDGLTAGIMLLASNNAPLSGPSVALIDGNAQLGLGGRHGGAWIGAGARRFVSDGHVVHGLHARGGARSTIGNIHLRVEIEEGVVPLIGSTRPIVFDSVPPPTPTPESKRLIPIAGTTARLTVALAGGRGVLDLRGGIVHWAEFPARRWGGAMVAIRMTPMIALLAGAGTRGPDEFLMGRPGEQFAQLGVRLERPTTRRSTPAASPGTVSAVRVELESCRADGRHALRVWAPAARTVEIAGDMTQWTSVALARDSSGWWTTKIALLPGLYQLSLRIDGGEWLPPPGLSTTSDGFGGLTGVIVIE